MGECVMAHVVENTVSGLGERMELLMSAIKAQQINFAT